MPSPKSREPASAGHPGRDAIEKIAFGTLPKIHTDSLLILKDGKTLYERYARGYSETSKHLSWSVGKSISAMIASQAIGAKKFNLDDKLSQWIPAYKGTATLLDVFQMSSGISFREEYSGIPVDSDVTKMLYLDGVRRGFANYVANLPLRSDYSPGDYFSYSSGDADLIMETLRQSLGSREVYDAYPWTSFFDRLGISDATIEQDVTGTFIGSSYVYMTTRDYARIGQLLANRGKWGADTLIPAWAFDLMNQVAPGVMKIALPGTSPTRSYSYQITTNLPIGGRLLPSEYPDLPLDSLLMIGHQGQLVISSPSENLVIVRMATDEGDPFNSERENFFAAIHRYLTEDLGIKINVAGGSATKVNATDETSGAAPSPKEKTPIGDYFRVPNLIRALYAKEYCSCRYVLGRSKEECDADLRLTLPFLPFKAERPGIVRAYTGLTASVAKYYGPKLGCTLIQ